jgi:hypothetical protein
MTKARTTSAAMLNDQGKGNGHPPATPFLFTPYTNSSGFVDDGSRPLPSSVPAWLCPAIHIDGLPYSGVPLTAGTPYNMSLVVQNGGELGALVTARLYFADPTTAFTAATLGKPPIFQETLYVGGLAQQETTPVSWTPDNTIPGHVCLLAEVASFPADPSSGTYDVVNDRHYGQQNINVVTVSPGQKKSFPFWIANVDKEAQEVEVTVRPVGEDVLRHLERFYKSESAAIRLEDLSVQLVEPRQPLHVKPSVKLKAKPGEQRRCQITVAVPAELKPNQFIAIEVEQATNPKHSGGSSRARVATLGIVAFAAGDQ